MSDLPNLKYELDRNIDGHPICCWGTPMTKKQVLNELNSMHMAIRQAENDVGRMERIAAFEEVSFDERHFVKSLHEQVHILNRPLDEVIGDLFRKYHWT